MTAITLVSCGNKKTETPDVESMGQLWVSKARFAMQKGDWTTARTMIDSLRTQTPTAFNAREDGILLLDSIELLAAKQIVDSLQRNPLLRSTDIFVQDSLSTELDRAQAKVHFFEKKIAVDQQRKQQH